jgi:glycosyltransferase involved in cell wall biosynthesis
MRIAYVTPYQGPTLIKLRPIVGNRSMSNRVKIELIAQLLYAKGHEVEIFSHGEVDSPEFRFYPAFEELEPFHTQIPVRYISALPVRGLYGMWASLEMTKMLEQRHNTSPFDVLIMFNFKPPQLAGKRYAERHGIPVILEYEDDPFRVVEGERQTFLVNRYQKQAYRQVISSVSACIGVSPYLLSQVPHAAPKLLLRGVVGDDLLKASERLRRSKKNIVLFSGTHNKLNGIQELIAAWRAMGLHDWQLHITGYGDLTDSLREAAEDTPGIVFHGLVNRSELVELMASAKICVSPQRVSPTLGDQFPFKVIEYLAAGAHVVMTPMGSLESEIEEGITYMSDNLPETIVSTLQRMIGEQRYGRTAEAAVQQRYGPKPVSESLDRLLKDVVGSPWESGRRYCPQLEISSQL